MLNFNGKLKGVTQKSNGNILLRLVINKSLRKYFNRVEFKKTYDINKYINLKEIIKDIENIKVDYEVIKEKYKMRVLTDSELQRLVDEFIVNNLNEDYEARINGSYTGSFGVGYVDGMNESPEDQALYALIGQLSELKEELADTNIKFSESILNTLLLKLNTSIDKLDVSSVNELQYNLKLASIEIVEEQLRRTTFKSKPKRIVKTKEPITLNNTLKRLTIEKAIIDYLEYYTDTNKTSQKTINEKEKALEYFLEVMKYIKIVYVEEIKKSDINTYVKKYLNCRPKAIGLIRNISFEDLVIGIDKDIFTESDNLSTNTINKQYQHINGFCNYLFDDGVITKRINQIKLEQELQNKEAFTLDEVGNITNYLKENNELYYKLFILYCLTGLRMNELLQSSILKEENTDILYFDVLGTKTDNARRMVPLHNKLIKINIDNQWLDELKNKYKNIKYISRKINELINDIVPEKSKTLYSTRHFFNTELLNTGVNKDIINKLVGHSDKKDLTVNTYGKNAFDLKVLKEAVDELKI